MTDDRILAAAIDTIRSALTDFNHRPVIIGICGAQGSGKTTLARALEHQCMANGIRSASLSIDDLYLTALQRQRLAEEVHPLLRTRGVPGTHDVQMGLRIIERLEAGIAEPLPRFDKLSDERFPETAWPLAPANCEVLIIEGWCVGAVAQQPEALIEPVNWLERAEDTDGTWRTFANVALEGDYQQLFSRIDRLIFLAAPGFEVVAGWRLQQERAMVAQGRSQSEAMDEEAINRFVAHYERITRAILTEMPHRADLVVRLDARRRPTSITRRPG